MVGRIRRLLRQRWLIIVLAVLLGTAAAVFVTRYFNDQIQRTIEATAVVSLLESRTDDGSTARLSTEPSATLSDAQEAAVEANEGFLDVRHVIRAVPATESLEFIASAGNPEEATREASDMRNRYLVAVAPPPIDERMQDVLTKAEFVMGELDRLTPPDVVVTSDPTVESQRALLNEQIRSLQSESAKLAVELVLADTDSARADLQADLDLILAQIVGLRTQLEAIPAPEGEDTGRATTEPDVGAGRTEDPVIVENVPLPDQFRIESLQSLYSDLLAEFQALYIRSVDAEPEVLPSIDVINVTGDPVDELLGAGIGLALGLLLALSAVILIDRLRPRWWTENDMKLPLAEVPARRSGGLEPWYWTTGPSPRKEAVQKVAVNLLPLLEAGPTTVGLLGLGVKPRALRGLTTDLAGTVVTAGRSSLVVDTTGLERQGKKPDPEAVPWDGTNLGDLLNPWQNGRNDDPVGRAVAGARKLWPGLSVIPSGAGSLYSVEGAMTPVVGQLVESARKSYALTAVSVADRGTALSDAFVRKVDAVMIVGRSGKTQLRKAEKVMDRLLANGSHVLGSVLIVRPTRRKLRQLLRGLFSRRPVRGSGGIPIRRNEQRSVAAMDHPNGSSEKAASAIDVREREMAEETPVPAS